MAGKKMQKELIQERLVRKADKLSKEIDQVIEIIRSKEKLNQKISNH